jgi:hypothetical protein
MEGALRRFVEALDRAGVPYMLTGSHAGGYWGPGRMTEDIDFVVMPTRDQLRALLDQLPSTAFYVDDRVAFEALNEHGQFNAIDFASAYKADFIIRKQRPFSEEEFRRRMHAIVADVPVMIATAEDVILSKLEWSKIGGSARQIEDAARILGSRLDRLDRAYIETWVRRIELDREWNAALREAGFDPDAARPL